MYWRLFNERKETWTQEAKEMIAGEGAYEIIELTLVEVRDSVCIYEYVNPDFVLPGGAIELEVDISFTVD